MFILWFKNLLAKLSNKNWQQKKGLGLIFIGIFFLTAAVFLKVNKKPFNNVSYLEKTPKPIQEPKELDLPAKILIPKVKINLNIIPSKAIDNDWEIATNSASYLLGSGLPGKKGNMVIYGHNKNNLFGPIRWLKKGDKIKVKTFKNKEFVYLVWQTKIVFPSEIEVLKPSQDFALTLYTCTGFLDKKRFVIKAKLQP